MLRKLAIGTSSFLITALLVFALICCLPHVYSSKHYLTLGFAFAVLILFAVDQSIHQSSRPKAENAWFFDQPVYLDAILQRFAYQIKFGKETEYPQYLHHARECIYFNGFE